MGYYKDWISVDIRCILIENHSVLPPFTGNKWHHESMLVSDFMTPLGIITLPCSAANGNGAVTVLNSATGSTLTLLGP
jgi:hypothetical protein